MCQAKLREVARLEYVPEKSDCARKKDSLISSEKQKITDSTTESPQWRFFVLAKKLFSGSLMKHCSLYEQWIVSRYIIIESVRAL